MTTEALPVELWETDRLVPYEKNAKKHPEEQIEKLAKAIERFGWDQPIVVDKDGVIIKGHGRRLAALKLGRKKVPVVIRRDLSPAECDALRLSDNRVVSTDYDMDLVNEELARFADDTDLIGAIGFDARELEFAIGDIAAMDETIFVDDIATAVEEQKTETDRKAGEADDIAAPVADAFGFKRVTIAQSREIRGYMSKIEATTGKQGVDALLHFFGDAASVLGI
jgi:ParB-like chromosome segregation protein Spo0J